MVHSLHVLSVKAVDKLKSGKPGDILTEKECEGIIGIAVRPGSEGKRRIGKAIVVTYRDHRVLWRWIKDVANDRRILACVPADDVVRTDLTAEQRRMRRCAIRLQQKSLCLSEELLENEDQRRLYRALQVQAMTVERAASTGITKKLVENGEALIAPDEAKLIELMKS